MTSTERVRAAAGAFTDAPTQLAEPLPIRDVDGRLAAWFVPLIDGSTIVGFVEVLPDLTHRRTSSFGGRGGGMDAADWVDPDVVARRAAAHLRPGEVPGTPFLSFDGVPDRLAWAVPVNGLDGPRMVWVAGVAVWSGSASTGLG